MRSWALLVLGLGLFAACNAGAANRDRALEARLVALIAQGDTTRAEYQAAIKAIRDPTPDAATRMARVQASIRKINDWRTAVGNELQGPDFRPGASTYVLGQEMDLISPDLERLRDLFAHLDRWRRK
jgi:hypothetical protein